MPLAGTFSGLRQIALRLMSMTGKFRNMSMARAPGHLHCLPLEMKAVGIEQAKRPIVFFVLDGRQDILDEA